MLHARQAAYQMTINEMFAQAPGEAGMLFKMVIDALNQNEK